MEGADRAGDYGPRSSHSLDPDVLEKADYIFRRDVRQVALKARGLYWRGSPRRT